MNKGKTIKQALFDAELINTICWADISRMYFGQSNSWLFQKLNGEDRNGNPMDFSEEELQTLKDSLLDLSKRIENFAMNIC